MQISIGVKQSGVDFSSMRFWDRRAMAELCEWSVATVVERTTQQGISAAGDAFAPYSTKAMTVSFDSETAQRLKPKGGLPAYGQGHARKLLTAKGRARKAQKAAGWAITGRHYPEGQGYAGYKLASRRGGLKSAAVDLTLSGQLMREVDAVSVTAEEGIVSIRGQARDYGTHVNDKRPFLGHHAGEHEDMAAAIMDASNESFARAAARSVGGKSVAGKVANMPAPSSDPVI